MLELDLMVASEISDRVKESTDKSGSGKAKGMAARLKQKRERNAKSGKPIYDGDDMLDAIREAGMPITEASDSDSEGETG